jgi:hypothetical protein
MTSINPALDAVVTALGSDAPLSAFCQAAWGKALTVLRTFRRRVEISTADLPICLLTCPKKVPGRYMDFQIEEAYTAMLYAGFQQKDPYAAQSQLMAFEELIENALLSFRISGVFPDGVQDIRPADAINDEGTQAPVYFLVKSVEIDALRDIPGG